jgi:hypothetical protein
MHRLLIAAILTAIPGAALADWKYTKWGMSLKDVLTASAGAAYKVKETKGDRVGDLRRLAEARVTEGSAHFIAELYFDKKAKRLELVRYRPAEPLSCLATDKLLVETFGEGTVERKPMDVPVDRRVLKLTTISRSWPQANGDRMSANMFQIESLEPQTCTMVFKPPAQAASGA